MAAVLVVDIVIVAIDRGGDRYYGFKCRRLQGRDLQAVKTTPGNTHHADRTVRPWLCRDPGNQLAGVGKLKLGIFAIDDTVRFTGATNIDSDAGDPGSCEHRIGRFIARACPVTLAVRQELEHGGNRIAVHIVRHPDARRQARTVLEGDPVIFDGGKAAVGHDHISRRRLSIKPYTAANVAVGHIIADVVDISLQPLRGCHDVIVEDRQDQATVIPHHQSQLAIKRFAFCLVEF